MTDSYQIVLVADAGPAAGLGHLVRQSAVAEAATALGLTTLVVTTDAGMEYIGALGVSGFAATVGDWKPHASRETAVLFDGYGFGPEDWAAAKTAGARVAQMDDFGTGDFDVDLLINPNPVPEPQYERPAPGQQLLGPAYAPIRGQIAGRRREVRAGTSRLLVAMGGADPLGLTATVLARALEAQVFDAIDAVVGPAAKAVDSLPGVTIHIAPRNLPDLMAQADAAVTAAGSTTWELMCIGVPSILVGIIDNQRLIVDGAADAGAALTIDSPDRLDAELPELLTQLADGATQERLAAAGQLLVDGRGALRIAEALAVLALTPYA